MLLWCFSFMVLVFFLFKKKTAYEMRIRDWSSDVCSSDLARSHACRAARRACERARRAPRSGFRPRSSCRSRGSMRIPTDGEPLSAPPLEGNAGRARPRAAPRRLSALRGLPLGEDFGRAVPAHHRFLRAGRRSEEHTSELQSLMRISYAVFCLTNKQHI